MAISSANHLKHNPLLTNLLIERGFGEGSVAGVIAPRNNIGSTKATYGKKDRQKSSAPVDTERAPGAHTKTGKGRGHELVTEHLVDHSLKLPIPQEITEGMEEQEMLAERISTAEDIVNYIENDWEEEVHEMAWASSAANFDAKFGTSQTLTPTTKWDAGTAKIKKDVMTGSDIMYKKSAKRPNLLVITREVLNEIATADNEIRDSLKYTNEEGPAVTMRKLAGYFEIPQVVVPDWLEDVDNQESNPEKDFLWKGDHVGLYYINGQMGRRITSFAKTFTTNFSESQFMETFSGFNRSNKSHEVEVSAYWHVAQIDKACAFFLTDLLS